MQRLNGRSRTSFENSARSVLANADRLIPVENGESSPEATCVEADKTPDDVFRLKVRWKRVILSARNCIPDHMDRPQLCIGF